MTRKKVMLKNNTHSTEIFEVENSIETKKTEILELSREEFLDFILDTIYLKETYSKMFLWTPSGNDSFRKRVENLLCGERKFIYEGHEYTYTLNYTSSSTYYRLHANRLAADGRGDVRDWKNLVKEIDPEVYEKCF